jgi:hypothetical protein
VITANAIGPVTNASSIGTAVGLAANMPRWPAGHLLSGEPRPCSVQICGEKRDNYTRIGSCQQVAFYSKIGIEKWVLPRRPIHSGLEQSCMCVFISTISVMFPFELNLG